MIRSNKLFSALLILSILIISHTAQAQNIIQTQKVLEEEKPILFGGGLLLGGGNNSFQLGLNPELLKSYNKYIDAGVIANIYYSSFSISQVSNEKIKNFQLGAGVFARVWPVEQFFIQIQPEYNRTWTSANNYSNGVRASTSYGATSILGGIGYVAGFTAPEGKTMGHAGAIVSGSSGTAAAKKEALEAVGVAVGKTPSETANLMRKILNG